MPGRSGGGPPTRAADRARREPNPERAQEAARRAASCAFGRAPDAAVACVGGGSNAIGLFAGLLDESARLFGVEPARGATLGVGTPGLLHGARTSVLQDGDGQILEAHSVAAGLDYPGVGPEHAALRDAARATYVSATDEEAVHAAGVLATTEGILPALESAHALAFALSAVERGHLPAGSALVLNLSGRGDKDLGST